MSEPETWDKELWFKKLFGFDEWHKGVYKNLEVVELGDQAILSSKVNNRDFFAGHFRIRNLPSFSGLTKHGHGSLNIIVGEGRHGPKAELVNVIRTQALPEFNGATFLAASDFNCMEFTSSGIEFVTNYVYDNTQGPYTALAAGAAAVYRVYFVPHGDGRIGQFEEEINLLQDTPLPGIMKHGYCIIQPSNIDELMKFDWSDLTKYYVGVHENCQVTTSEDANGRFYEVPDGQFVNQIYAAAFNFGGTAVIKTEDTLKITKYLLMAQYQATVMAAWELSEKYPDRPGSKKLVLTLLGGGVFYNPISLICEAISSCEEMIADSGLEVYVVSYDGLDFDEISELLKPVMKRTHGKVIKCAE